MNVAIVLDPEYSGLDRLIEEMPVWAVDSASNRATAEQFWKMRGSADASQGVTLFKVADELDAENNCIRIVGQVDLHHGIYSSGSKISILQVIGAKPSESIQEELKAYDLVIFEVTRAGFIARGLPQSSPPRVQSATPSR